MLTSILLAAKFYDDIFFDNSYYSRVGGITNSELNQLEIRFLHLTSFEIYVSPQLYTNYVHNLLSHFK